jgi:hypothetical protein
MSRGRDSKSQESDDRAPAGEGKVSFSIFIFKSRSRETISRGVATPRVRSRMTGHRLARAR